MVEKTTLRKVNQVLLLGVLICATLYFAQKVLIPLAFSVFFAMLFTPLSNRLESWGWKRGLTAFVSLLIIVSITLSIGYLVFLQARKLAEDMPKIEQKSERLMKQAQQFVSWRFDVSEDRQNAFIKKQVQSGAESVKKALLGIFTRAAGTIGASVLVLIFTFLFLLQREKYESFFLQLCYRTQPAEAKKLIGKISKVSQNYLTGRALSVLIFTVLFYLGFLIVGLETAFLLAFVAALLTIVPYVGSIVGGLFPFAVALVTEDSSSAAWGALGVVLVIQGIDNYFIEPYIIGGEVNISGFFTILILLVGGLLWGVAGMVLFLPMLAVAKIVFDEVPELKPYGYLIGDQEENKQSERIWKSFSRFFGKKE